MPCIIDRKLTFGEIQTNKLREDVDELTSALCGLCRMMKPHYNLHPQLDAWFEKHKLDPRCELYKEKSHD